MAKKTVSYKASEVITNLKKIEMTGKFDKTTGVLVTDDGNKNILEEVLKLGDGLITITVMNKVEDEKEL
jgi:DNA-directed RNA polymerase subunit E'/Rpb7